MNYNSNESTGEENGRQRYQRGIRKASGENRQKGNRENFANSTREEISTRYGKDNISQKSIKEVLTDLDSKRKVIDFAKKNQIIELDSELKELDNISNELGINLILYNGENENEYVGLMENNNMYLDINENNVSKEDGTIQDRFFHEVLHYLKRNTSLGETIRELQLDILKNYKESVNEYIEKKVMMLYFSINFIYGIMVINLIYITKTEIILKF